MITDPKTTVFRVAVRGGFLIALVEMVLRPFDHLRLSMRLHGGAGCLAAGDGWTHAA
jgi:hypothetical protein